MGLHCYFHLGESESGKRLRRDLALYGYPGPLQVVIWADNGRKRHCWRTAEPTENQEAPARRLGLFRTYITC